MSEFDGIKALVTEQNGEISCSIEETNRIRALLGLRPLNEKKSSSAVDNFKKVREDETKAKETALHLANIQAARNKRLLNEKLKGKSLGDAFDETESSLLSASDWVRRSRVKATEIAVEETEKQVISKPKQNAYKSEDLAGLQVTHDLGGLDQGEQIILTLADSNILETDDHGRVLGVNQDFDTLENVNLAEEERRLLAEKKKKRLKMPVYSGYDDNEFMEVGKKRSLLSQYDEEVQTGPKFQIGQQGVVVANKDHTQDEDQDSDIRAKANYEDLRTEVREASDFLTREEYAATFKKKGVKKTKKLRRRDDEDEGLHSNSNNNSVFGSDQMDIDDGGFDGGISQAAKKDRGSRNRSHVTSTSMSLSQTEEERRRRENYEQALRAAQEKTARTFAQGNNASNVRRDDDDTDVAVSMERVRRLAETRRENTDAADEDKGALVALKLVETLPQIAKSFAPSDQMTDNPEDDEVDAEGRRKDGRLVFTSTTEFSARLQAQLNEKARSRTEAIGQDESAWNETEDALVDSSSRADWMSGSVDDSGRGESAGNGDMDIGSGDDDDNESDNDQMAFIHDKQLASKGMAAALALFKSKGELGKKEEQYGRNKDVRNSDGSEDKVNIEYRDKHGRKLTPKEAFRQLCYKFHGYGPSKKTVEKREKAQEHQHKTEKALKSEAASLAALTKAQEATGKAHITIQGGTTNNAFASQMASVLLAKARAKKEKMQQK